MVNADKQVWITRALDKVLVSPNKLCLTFFLPNFTRHFFSQILFPLCKTESNIFFNIYSAWYCQRLQEAWGNLRVKIKASYLGYAWPLRPQVALHENWLCHCDQYSYVSSGVPWKIIVWEQNPLIQRWM